jgi:hypothetical protein
MTYSVQDQTTIVFSLIEKWAALKPDECWFAGDWMFGRIGSINSKNQVSLQELYALQGEIQALLMEHEYSALCAFHHVDQEWLISISDPNSQVGSSAIDGHPAIALIRCYVQFLENLKGQNHHHVNCPNSQISDSLSLLPTA